MAPNKDNGKLVEGVPWAASFAVASASSLPVIPECPGVYPTWAIQPERGSAAVGYGCRGGEGAGMSSLGGK